MVQSSPSPDAGLVRFGKGHSSRPAPAATRWRPWRTPDEVAALARRARRGETAGRAAIYAALILLSLPIIVPYLWLVAAAFSRRVNYGLVPSGFTLDNWRFLWAANLGFVAGTMVDWPCTSTRATATRRSPP
jgi:hypothetical protein